MLSTHQVKVVKIEALLPHTNADSLNIVMVGGYQCIVKKDAFKVGDLAVYIQPESVVPQTEPFKFIWEPYIGIDGTVPEKRRRIKVRKFRKAYSEGLLMPLNILPPNDRCCGWNYPEGMDVADILGVTHYEPAEMGETRGETACAPRRKYPHSLKGWFFFLLRKCGFRTKQYTEEMSLNIPEYDVDAFKNFTKVIQPNEYVLVTEKIHGSNARFTFWDDHFYAGSHRQWKHEKSPCVFRRVTEQDKYIEQWCREHPGYTVYGEVVPTQKDFDYGCEKGMLKFFAFDVRTPNGDWVWPTYAGWTGNVVPVLYTGKFVYKDTLLYAEGTSHVAGANHIREGVCIRVQPERRIPGLGRVHLKIKSLTYLARKTNAE
jgi:hypothetical protein